MREYVNDLYNLGVGLLCFLAFGLLFLALWYGLTSADPAVKLPLLVITGVMALFVTLALVAVTFSVAGLSDSSQALGLPEGSVRAAIALSLIVIFATTSVFFYSSMAAPGATPASQDFAKQVFAVVGTLMTSVSSFYFASRSGTASALATPLSTPNVTSIAPTDATRAEAAVVVPVQILGAGLQLIKSVKLVKGTAESPASDVTSNDELVKCKVTLDPSISPGKYDVVVTASDGRSATLPAAFEVK